MRAAAPWLLLVWILKASAFAADAADEEKRKQFLKAREEMRTVPMTPSPEASPKPKPKPVQPMATPEPAATPKPPPEATPKPKPKPEPVNQHWVPKFYLRYFATPQTRETDSPRVWIFSKRDKDGDEKLTHARNVCAKRFLYTDDEGVRKGLSLFMAIMHLRNPAVREQVERMHQSILDSSFKDAPLRPDGNPDVEEVEINGKVHAIDTHGWQAYRAWGRTSTTGSSPTWSRPRPATSRACF